MGFALRSSTNLEISLVEGLVFLAAWMTGKTIAPVRDALFFMNLGHARGIVLMALRALVTG
jgi:hypothetical protein